MNDYKVFKKKQGWIIKALTLKIFGYSIYMTLRIPVISSISDGHLVLFMPVFNNYEEAIMSAEFIKEHIPRKYKGFLLEPVFEECDGFLLTERKLYVFMRMSWSKIGTYLELTGIIDDVFGGRN